MKLDASLENELAELAAGEGLELLAAELVGSGPRSVLRLVIDGGLIEIDDETAIKYQLDAALGPGFARRAVGLEPDLCRAGPASDELGEEMMRASLRVGRRERHDAPRPMITLQQANHVAHQVFL